MKLSIKHNGDWIRAVALIKGSILKLMKIMHVIKILHGIYVDLKEPKADKKESKHAICFQNL